MVALLPLAALGAAARPAGVASGVRRGAVALAVLGAVAGLVVTGLVVWIGHAGSTAVSQGVVQ